MTRLRPASRQLRWFLVGVAALLAASAVVWYRGRAQGVRTLSATAVPDALLPSEAIGPLIPQPKHARLDYDHPVPLDTVNRPLRQALDRRFAVSWPQSGQLRLDAAVLPSLRPGAYTVTIAQDRLSVLASDALAMRYATERLAQLAFARKGALWLPSGTLEDWPSSPWRGVHLFVGPNALPFQRKLWERVLLPLGFNKVVLECEQTRWKSTPGIDATITMPEGRLIELFAMYRSLGVEPIPLIQSLGHMAWLFANGRNKDLALDPSVPWAIDPRKPKAQALLSSLWDEAITSLHPKTVHFGLDEVGLRGSPGESPLLTGLWRQQLGYLGQIAKRHGVRPMLWGDQALAPGEAVDFALAANPQVAAARRAAIPKGAIIADWHYATNSDPAAFGRSLDLWTSEGFEPVAAAWYSPENVRAFNIAAAGRGLGTLQTTWAGYESSESNLMGSNLRQFTATILAAEYAWSGRRDPLDKLGYEPGAVFREMYFGEPHPLSPQPGFLVGEGPLVRVGDVRFRRLDLPALGSMELDIDAPGRQLALAFETTDRRVPGQAMGQLQIALKDGGTIHRTIVYGQDVRTAEDPDPCVHADRAGALCGIRVDLGPGIPTVKRIFLTAQEDTHLRLIGVTVLG